MVLTLGLLAGPLGQCHPIPDDPQLKAEMLKHARNHHRIHSRYNLPYQSAPGSDMAKVSTSTVPGHVLFGEGDRKLLPRDAHHHCRFESCFRFPMMGIVVVYHLFDKPCRLGSSCACGDAVLLGQAIEAFKEKVAALRKKARRVRELERRRLRRVEQRTGARSSAPARDEVLRLPSNSLRLTPSLIDCFCKLPTATRHLAGSTVQLPGMKGCASLKPPGLRSTIRRDPRLASPDRAGGRSSSALTSPQLALTQAPSMSTHAA